MDSSACVTCGNDFSLFLAQCPHCGQPGTVPNAKMAVLPAETKALDRRYRAALRDATGRGCRATVDSFEVALADSKAVINCRLNELDRLASSDQQLYASYYERLRGGVRAPYGGKWDRLRQAADPVLFPLCYERVHFAALTLDGFGVRSYGECSLVLRESMIARRASVFEENSATFLQNRANRLRPGYRGSWEERFKLCIAKLASQIGPSTVSAEFPGILLYQGKIPEGDRFVEVHIWGALSI